MLLRVYYFVVILPLFLISCSKAKQEVQTNSQDTSAAAVSTGPFTVHTIITRTRDSSLTPTDTTHIFSPRDTIHGVIHSNNAREGTVIVGRWFYANGQKVAENSTRLSAGPNISYFDLMSEAPWPVGEYKLLIVVDSNIVDSAHFAVVGKK